MFDLRRELMTHLQKLDLAFYDRNPVGRLVTRVTTDVDVLNELFASGLVTILGDLLMLSFIVFVMFQLSPLLTVHPAGGMPLVILVTMHVPAHGGAELPAHPRGHRQDQFVPAGARRRASSCCSCSTARRRAARNSRASIASTWRRSRTPSPPTAGSIRWWSSSACWRWPASWPMAASACSAARSRSGVVVAFLQYGLRFFRPIQDLSEKYNILQSAMASSERIFKLLDTHGRDPAAGGSAARAGRARAHRVRSRLVRLQGRRLGAARRQLPHRARRDHRRGRPHRRGQDHAHQPAAALLRHPAGQHSDRRRGHPRSRSAGAAPPLRRRAAGSVSVHRHARGQHPAGHREHHARGDRRPRPSR